MKSKTGPKAVSKNKLSLMIIKPRGGASSFFVSPWLFGFGCLFALGFLAVSLIIINRYFVLYLDHKDLTAAHQDASKKLLQLQNLHEYQAQLHRDFAAYLKAAEDAAPFFPPAAAGEEADAEAPKTGEARPFFINPLEAWAESLPAVDPETEQNIDVEDFSVTGSKFKFKLVNNGGALAQGHILALFAVKFPGEAHLTLTPYGGFDPKSAEPDFEDGIAYNLRLSKPVSGRLDLPPGAEIKEMAIVARAKSGEITLKKKIRAGINGKI